MACDRLVLCSLVIAAALAAALARPGETDNKIDEQINTTTTPGPTTTPASADAPIPVNERFPHAVLFGGTCGGSIISPTWIVTAAHCSLFTPGRYIIAGTNNTDDESGHYERVKRLIIHPKFAVGPYWVDADEFGLKQVGARWDFMLAELKNPLPLDGKKMAAVKLDDQKILPPGLDVSYAGYGAEHHGETMRTDMHGMELVTVADDTCAKLVEFEPQDMFCTQGKAPRFDSACNGDSGSGLVGDGRLLGVASWVENDAHECRNGALVYFSRLSLVRDWIRNTTGV